MKEARHRFYDSIYTKCPEEVIHRDRKQISGGGGGLVINRVTVHEHGVSFWGDGNSLELVMMITHYEYTKITEFVYFKMLNFTLYEFYLNI